MSWKEEKICFPEIPYIRYEHAEVYTLGGIINTTVESLPTEELVELINDLVKEVATRKYKEKHES